MKQGDIYLADLNPVKGHEQAGLRPVMVIQRNALNDYLSTVIVIPITSNLTLLGSLLAYFLPAGLTGLDRDSLALLHQVRILDKIRLIKRVGQLEGAYFEALKSDLIRMI